MIYYKDNVEEEIENSAAYGGIHILHRHTSTGGIHMLHTSTGGIHMLHRHTSTGGIHILHNTHTVNKLGCLHDSIYRYYTIYIYVIIKMHKVSPILYKHYFI